MDRNQLLNNIQRGLQRMELLELRKQVNDPQDLKPLNPLFGYSEAAATAGINRKGVSAVWMDSGADRLKVKVLPRGYAGDEIYISVNDLDNKQLKGIADMINNLCHKRVQDHKRTEANPNLKDILPQLERWAQKCVSAIPGGKYTAALSYGKRAVDNDNYHAIVVNEGKWQIGSIPLRQDKYGRLTYNEHSPVAGEWGENEELVLQKCLAQIKESIRSITGHKYIHLDDAKPMLELEEHVRQLRQKSMEDNMTVKVKVQSYNSWLPYSELNRDKYEVWKLDYQHSFKEDGTVNVQLVGQRMDEDGDRDIITLANGKVDMNNPEKPFILEFEKEDEQLVQALVKTGHAKMVGQRTERYEDYPEGYEEVCPDIEQVEADEFHFLRVDVSEGYRRYLNDRNGMNLFCPFENIRQTWGPDLEDRFSNENVSHLKCRQAGMLDFSKICSNSEARPVELTRGYAAYDFVAKELAMKTFDKAVQQHREAQRRLTDAEVTWTREGTFIRCSIDGVQQMRKSIPRGLADETTKAPDRKEAERFVAAFAYRNELKPQTELNKGMKI